MRYYRGGCSISTLCLLRLALPIVTLCKIAPIHALLRDYEECEFFLKIPCAQTLVCTQLYVVL